ncbi:iron-containing alcohol dehydrogenase [Bacterioplanoides sp.]|uniref:iron-containing alcohol dehydrogenase n=1 Tax=Bacterioplanoides sp. TaxID=2066072 RepID=UPI003AFFBD79
MFNSIMTIALRALATFYPSQKPLLFSGSESAIKLADFMIDSGVKHPLLVTDSFLLANGMLDHLIAHIRERGCEVTTFDGIIPNPTTAVIEAGLAAAQSNQCDAVFAVGGGSAIDAAKVIAAASSNRKPIQALAGILKLKQPLVPFYVVPTTSGTGSESTSAAVISDTQSHKKQFFVDPKYIPLAAALDTGLLKSLPPAITATTGMDALTHAIEAYTAKSHFADSDRDAAMAIRLLVRFLPEAYNNGNNEYAREMVAIASFLAGYAFNKAGLGYVHAISHQISAHYNTAHGLANAVILPRVLRFNQSACVQRYAELEALLSATEIQNNAAELAQQFIARVDQLSDTLNIPAQLTDLQPQDFAAITTEALAEARRSYAVPRVMKKAQAEVILQSVYNGKRDISFSH